ncbi:unnamed protein product [Fusarium fujikuroi]|nr:unnamed protein product [Fusarium fujikuroi]
MSSPASHRDESTDLSPTVTNTSMDSEPKKAGKRVLSCVLCQQRKKKCDRKSPCSNCIRSALQVRQLRQGSAGVRIKIFSKGLRDAKNFLGIALA